MSRAARLLGLVHILRQHRWPVSGVKLAQATGVSLRTLYRDIDTLKAQGADIEGEAGVGFVLRPGFMLPPLMFSESEIEALALGARWVSMRTDAGLAEAARSALAKISAILPQELGSLITDSQLLVGPNRDILAGKVRLPAIRDAIRRERKISMVYVNAAGEKRERTIWPFALSFFEAVRIVVAWCEVQQSFRHFRVDRIEQFCVLEERYPRRRHALLKAWRHEEGIMGQIASC